LEQADQTDDLDLKMKLLSNLSESCLIQWDLDAANRYLDRALTLNTQNNLNNLSTLYLYGNKINSWILQGDFAQAAKKLKEVWSMVENSDLLKYSKYEYFQIIFLLRNYDAVANTALGQCETALRSLQMAEGLVQDARAVELKVSTHLSRMYYELLCQKDEAAARQHEQKAIDTSGGKLPGNTMLGIALYMKYNHRDDWAKQYAQQVLEAAASDPTIPAGAIACAENLVKVIA
jgi:tetratricopeptide (TPR) repeat protein